MQNSGLLYSIASVFFGIVAVATSMIFFISFPAAVLAIAFGVFAVRRYYRKSGATAIVLGLIGIVITIVVFVNIVQALDVDSLIAGNWNTENNEYIKFTDSGAYIWYPDKSNVDEYASGYYKLATGIYKSKGKYTMGYTVVLNQITYATENGSQEISRTDKWLIYTPGEEVLDGQSDTYEMMNLETGRVVKISKEKVKLFGIFGI